MGENLYIAGTNTSWGAAVTRFFAFNVGGAGDTTEAVQQMDVNFSGTLKNLLIRVPANTCTTNETLITSINTLDGNLSASITALTTGVFEDTVNTDAIAANDKVVYQGSACAAGTSISFTIMSTTFVSDTNTNNRIFAGGGFSYSTASTRIFFSLGGGLNPNSTTESNTYCNISSSFTQQNLYVNVRSNARASSATTLSN